MPYPNTPLKTLQTAGCARRLSRHLHRIASLAVLLCASLLGPAQAALDSTALTDDHSINVPTEWWTYTNKTPQELSDKAEQHGARIVGLEVSAVSNAGEPRFTARLVANAGPLQGARLVLVLRPDPRAGACGAESPCAQAGATAGSSSNCCTCIAVRGRASR